MVKRFQISLPDDVAATLEKLAEDCSLPQSIIITQLIRRYHSHLRQLLSVDCNLLQPTATIQPLAPHQAVEHRIEVQPTATNGSKPAALPRTPMKPF